MANTKNPKIKPVNKKNNQQSNFTLSNRKFFLLQKNFWMLLIAIIVMVSMLLSGVYYLGLGSGTGTSGDQSNPSIKYNSYKVTPYISPNPILVKVNETQKQYIALSAAQCLSNQVIGWVYNLSVPGISAVMMDAANPVAQEGMICGESYLLFRFSIDNPTNETLPRLENELNNRLGNYFMKQLYSGTIMNGSIPTTGKIEIIGNLDTLPGDLVEIIVFQMENNNIIALEKQKIYLGPTVPGKVISIEDLIARGTINETFNSTGLEELNVIDSSINLPKISLDTNLSENLTGEISNITGVTISSSQNTTQITYNNSFREVRKILSRADINYTIINGSASLQMPANTSIELAEKILSDRGLTDLTFKKSGSVALPQTVLFTNITATIPNNGNYTTILELGTKAGDNINVTLTALQFGDQIFIAGSKQEV
jgi:hypothetical protein